MRAKMDISRLYTNFLYCREVIKSCENSEQLDGAINLCTNMLDREEYENDIKNRTYFWDYTKYFFLFRFNERRTYIQFIQQISNELQEIITDKIDDINDESNTKDKQKHIGFSMLK